MLQDGYCKECVKQYTDIKDEWCKSCQTNDLKMKFTNWTSGNKQIDDLIQEVRSKINKSSDIIFEWIPYDQFRDIEEIGNGGFATVYSATWERKVAISKTEHSQLIESKIALKCLYKSQNITNEFLNEV